MYSYDMGLLGLLRLPKGRVELKKKTWSDHEHLLGSLVVLVYAKNLQLYVPNHHNIGIDNSPNVVVFKHPIMALDFMLSLYPSEWGPSIELELGICGGVIIMKHMFVLIRNVMCVGIQNISQINDYHIAQPVLLLL